MTETRSRYFIPALAGVLYFSEGFPFGIVNETVNLYLSYANVSLPAIGLIGGVGVLWTFKFLWAPLVDALLTYRLWILAALLVLAASIAMLGSVPPAGTAFMAALMVMVFASATHDIAVDALIIRTTPDEQLGIVNSTRVAAYRGAMIVAGGVIAILADSMSWRNAFFAAAVVPLVIFAVVLFAAPRERTEGERHENPLRGLVDWVKRPGALMLLAVILFYRFGDNSMTAMVRPYWESRGFSVTEVANVTTTLGMICTILGAIVGGAFVSRVGVYRGLVVLGLVQMLSNLSYALTATLNGGRPALYTSAVLETFCGGLGTAAFLSFLMFICDKSNAATEYAMLSAVFTVGRTLAIAPSGFLANALGFAGYYWLTAALALPGLALLPFIRQRLQKQHAPPNLH